MPTQKFGVKQIGIVIFYHDFFLNEFQNNVQCFRYYWLFNLRSDGLGAMPKGIILTDKSLQKMTKETELW